MTIDPAKLLEGISGNWHYRPRKSDDWGTVRNDYDGGWPVARAMAGRFETVDELDVHRRNKTDPYERVGRLIAAAPALARALIEARAEIRWLRTSPTRAWLLRTMCDADPCDCAAGIINDFPACKIVGRHTDAVLKQLCTER